MPTPNPESDLAATATPSADRRSVPVACLWLLTCLLVTALWSGCGNLESKRIEQLLNHRGWGGRVHGDAQIENYVAFGDQIQFFLPPSLLTEAGTEPLGILAMGQIVAIDGTIFIPFIGAIPVLGLTERELSRLVSDQVQAVYNIPIQVQARIVNNQKFYFLAGEFRLGRGRRLLPGDYTILDAFMDNPTTALANIGRLRLVRPDPKNPLVVVVNARDMILTGDTTWNIAVREHDIIYLPPTFLGAIARVLERILLPFTTILNSLFQALWLRQGYQALVNGEPFYFPYGYNSGQIY